MKIGFDFDNTIIFYDKIFYKIALERSLIPKSLPANKKLIRDFLVSKNREEDFTLMQAEVYGKRIVEAKPAEGLIECLKILKQNKKSINIISHKTKFPYKGPKYNLHISANKWLEKNRFFDKQVINLSKDNVFFEETKINKIKRIKNIGCTHFIDDLPEILNMIDFDCIRILYDPESTYKGDFNNFKIIKKWEDLHYFIN